jgi:hypothetical protein
MPERTIPLVLEINCKIEDEGENDDEDEPEPKVFHAGPER